MGFGSNLYLALHETIPHPLITFPTKKKILAHTRSHADVRVIMCSVRWKKDHRVTCWLCGARDRPTNTLPVPLNAIDTIAHLTIFIVGLSDFIQ